MGNEAGIYDKATDEIKRRYGMVESELKKRNKGKNPFRMKPMSDTDILAKYMSMTPEDMQVAQEAAPQQFYKFMEKAQKLILKERANG